MHVNWYLCEYLCIFNVFTLTAVVFKPLELFGKMKTCLLEIIIRVVPKYNSFCFQISEEMQNMSYHPNIKLQYNFDGRLVWWCLPRSVKRVVTHTYESSKIHMFVWRPFVFKTWITRCIQYITLFNFSLNSHKRMDFSYSYTSKKVRILIEI